MELELDPGRVKRLTEEKESENARFRDYLKSFADAQHLGEFARCLYDEVAPLIDCAECANCCMDASASLAPEDVERMAEAMGLSPEQFDAQYLVANEREPEKRTFGRAPCPLLADKRCRLGEQRPECCRDFASLRKERFVSLLMEAQDSRAACPIDYNAYERLKCEVWARGR